MLRIAGIVLILLTFSGLAQAADWPQYRGPSCDGFAPDKGINKNWNQKPPKVLWKFALGDNGYAGPAVAGGRVFMIDHRGSQDVVLALDFKTGKRIWQYAYTQSSEDESNKKVWGYGRTTPSVSQGRVYAMGRLGMLTCLDAKTGKKIWSRDIIKDFKGTRTYWWYAVSPLIDGNKVIIQPGGPDASVAVLDKLTGKTIWQGGGSEVAGYATPQIVTINGKRQYLVFTCRRLLGIDPDNGKMLWDFLWETPNEANIAAPIVIGNSIFITSDYNQGCAMVDVTPEGAKARWTSKAMMSQFSSPVFYKGYVYSSSDPNGDLMCLDPQTGDVKWKQPGFQKGPVIGVDDVLIAVDGTDGDCVMVEFNSDGYKEIGRFKPLGGQTWVAPVISNGRMLIRNRETLACVELR